MKTIKLKDALARKLEDGWAVKAALFTTFNFEPRFFENYVLPILLPDVSFGQNVLQNAIRWRFLYRDPGRVPQVVVYADQYAKSSAEAPMLDYATHAISMPGTGQQRGAFHPKISMVLAQRGREEKLILICGSGNITQAGWCSNVEGVVVLELIPGTFYPDDLRKALRDFITTLQGLRKTTESSSNAEEAILAFFRKHTTRDEPACQLYHSGQGSFRDYLEKQVLADKPLRCIEVFSPYFNPQPEEISWLRKYCEDVRVQTPMWGSTYCALDQSVYDRYAATGATWYDAAEVIAERWSHAKAYRFLPVQGTEVITVIGSVNMTRPGWAGLGNERSTGPANMEAALLIRSREPNSEPWLQNPAHKEHLTFMPELMEEGAENETAPLPRYHTPDILFTLDWRYGRLSWVRRGRPQYPCTLLLPGMPQTLEAKGAVNLNTSPEGRQLLKALAKDCLLRVKETVGSEARIHYYYPAQAGFAQKPFPIRLSAADILDLWARLERAESLSDEAIAKELEKLTARYVTDESGEIREHGLDRPSLLNEVARHLSGLVRLEKYLLPSGNGHFTKQQRAELIYQLTAYNIATLPAYLRELEQRMDEDGLAPGFLFVILTIVKERFYQERAFRKMLGDDAHECLQEFRAVSNSLDALLTTTQRRMDLVDSERIQWFKKQLAQ